MKRIIFTVAMMILMVSTGVSQEKGFYLTVGGNVGLSQFKYQMDNHRYNTPQLGYGGSVGLQWFFSRHWGLATGVGLSYYNTLAKYNNSFEKNSDYSFAGLWDYDTYIGGDGEQYTLQVSLDNWREYQEAWFLEVPLMMMYQTKWGKKQHHGMYIGLGAKAQIPMFGEQYQVDYDSKLTLLGYYPQSDLTLGTPIPLHGFGSNDNLPTDGEPYTSENLNVKTSFAATGELGFLIGLNRRVDLTIGGYIDYGLNNIKDGNNSETGYLIEPQADKRQTEVSYIGENMTYNGIINSNVVDDVKLFSAGGKIGLRIKLGKLKEEVIEEEKPEELVATKEVVEPKPEPAPVVVVEPVVPVETGITEAELAILMEPIFFDLAKYNLKTAAIMSLDRKVAIMNKYPEINLRILGNTCDLGGDRINIPLGQNRADAARNYLEEHGVSRIRMTTVTQASGHPIVPNTNEENRSKNRRDDFEPSGFKK